MHNLKPRKQGKTIRDYLQGIQNKRHIYKLDLSHKTMIKLPIFLLFVFSYCIPVVKDLSTEHKPELKILHDTTRNRDIPIALYKPTLKAPKKPKIIIFSHGYGQNKGGDYLAYSYLTHYLALTGYFVVSIQHELATDSLLPLKGNLKVVRRPFWERGADNIFFVISVLKKTHTALDFNHITLIGHSNGGDMTALFPQKHAGIVDKIITLDNRRMALPRTKQPRVYSLRSSNQLADSGVLPTKEEQKKYATRIVNLHNITHNEMDDSANEAQRMEIQKHVLSFLKEW